MAVAIPWLALHFPVGAAPVLADTATQASTLTVKSGSFSVDGMSWSDSGTLIVPALVNTPLDPDTHHRDIIYYRAHLGDTLQQLAGRYGLSVNTLIWSNPGAVDRLTDNEEVLIPPVDGVLVTVQKNDTVASLALKYRAEADAIIQFNFLRHPQTLPVGQLLMIPYGVGPEPPSVPTADPRTITAGHRQWVIDPIWSNGGGLYPFGQCTWYVNSRRPAPWGGNAWQWYGRARQWGRPEGATPRVGAIMVTWESPYWGHVAYVEQVYPDGSWLVSEMNYYGVPGGGWGRVDYRHILPNTIPLIGFIY
jgi:LysM repeat protein